MSDIYVYQSVLVNKSKQCHLFGGNLNKLHTVAIRLGLKRMVSYNFKGITIYDLSERQRKRAMNYGAELVDIKEANLLIKNIRHDIQVEGDL